MLNKLLKHEIKDTARVIPFFYLVAAIFAGIVLVSKMIGIGWFETTSSVVLMLVGFSVIIITFVVVVLRFYRNLFTSEGYLMFTLPIKPQLLLVSKTIVAFCWLIVSITVFFLAISVSLYGLGIGFNDVKNIIKELERLGLEDIIDVLIPMVFLSVLYLLGQIYFSITVANRPVFQALGAAGAFVVFIVTYIVLQIFEAIITIFVPLSLEINLDGDFGVKLSTNNMFGYLVDSVRGIEPTTFNIGIGGYIFGLIMVCVLFYLTGRMMNKKVSLR